MTRIEPKRNLIAIQDAYVAAVEAAYSRWAHRPRLSYALDGVGGFYGRRVHAARLQAYKELAAWGFSPAQAREVIQDAHQVALLERHAQEVN